MVGQDDSRACVEGNSGSVWCEMVLEVAVKSYKYYITQEVWPSARGSCFLTEELDNGLVRVRVIMGEDRVSIISYPLYSNTL